MNRLDALKYFVVAADTLNFRATAAHFSVSPQVITRVIGELENELGEVLFKRNTRSIRLTEFGGQLLPQARQFLLDEQRLFGIDKADNGALSGLVRLTLPPSLYAEQVLTELFAKLADYPDIALDIRIGYELLKAVEDSIDIGVRICQTPEPHWITKKIYDVKESVLASPKLVERLGMPKDIDDLIKHFPVGTLLNTQTGRGWDWNINNQNIPLLRTHLLAAEPYTLLQALLAGRIFAPFELNQCAPHLARGELVEIFPTHLTRWACYLYRPYQTITPKRVLLVYELLGEILTEWERGQGV